jgi:protein-S-isoprenylcysteine O-methyltransferase Ste14
LREGGSQPWTPLRIAGVVIGLPELALLVLARIELGGSFSVRPKAQTVVTLGLYSRIRSPIYLFGGLAVAGFFLYIDQPLAFWLFVVLIPLQIYRARQQAKSSRQDSVTNTASINREPDSDKLRAFR